MSDYNADSSKTRGISGITNTNLSISKFYSKSSPTLYLYYALDYASNSLRYGAVACNWTAPIDCCIEQIQFYIGNGDNGTSVSIWTSAGTTFLSGFWPFQPYDVMTISPSGISYGGNNWGSSVFSTQLANTRITAGTVVTVYVSP